MQSIIRVGAERSSAVGNQGRVGGSREAKRRDSTGPAGALNRAYFGGAIELKLAFAEVAEARLVNGGGADGGGVGDVDLLGARSVDAGKVAGGGAGGLEFGERIERVVVVEVVVDRGLLIVVEGMIDADLKLISAVGFVRGHLNVAGATGAGYVLQQANGHGIETLRRNLEVWKNGAVGLRGSATGNGGHRGARGGTETWAAAGLKDVGDGRVGQRSSKSWNAAGSQNAIGKSWGRKIAVGEFGRGGNADGLRDDALNDATPLIGAKEEGLVFLDRAANGAAELVLPEFWFRGLEKRKRMGVQDIVAEEFVEAAMNRVRAGFGYHVDDGARVATILRVKGIGDYAKLFDAVRGR